MSNSRKQLALIAVLALLLRVAFSLGYWVDQPLTHDEQEYLQLANSLVAGKGLVYDDDRNDHFSRAPGYPAFLAAALSVRHSLTFVRVMQSGVGVAGVLAIAALAWHTGGARAGIIAALIAAVYPPFVWQPAYLLRELLYSVLALTMALTVWWIVASGDAGRQRRALLGAVLAGGVLGACMLVRPNVALFGGFAVIYLLARGAWKPAGIIAISAAMVLLPWSARASLRHERFMLVSSLGGVAFWIGNNSHATGVGDLTANPAIGRAERQIRAAHFGLTPEEMEPIYLREAVAFIQERPWEWFTLLFKKLFYFVVPVGASMYGRSALFRVSSWISYFGLLALGVAGAARLVRTRPQPVLVWLLGLSAIATCLVFYAQPRYRVPVFDPVLVVCASTLWRESR